MSMEKYAVVHTDKEKTAAKKAEMDIEKGKKGSSGKSNSSSSSKSSPSS